MTIALDTNVLLVSVSPRSPYHWLYQALRERRYDLVVSSAILLEYEEIIGRHMGKAVADDVLDALTRFSHIRHVHRYYRWDLIQTDYDDNKFVDCAIAGQADAIVTYDKHFHVLREVNFPRLQILTPEEFRLRLEA